MILMHILIGAAAAVATLGYICRLDALHISQHRPAVVLLHLALAVLCVVGLAHAWEQSTDLQDVAGVVAAATWLLKSAENWRAMAVPQRARYGWEADS